MKTRSKSGYRCLQLLCCSVTALLCLTALSAKAATLNNWARAGIATQSSTYPGGDASKAIDGNTSGWWTDGSITHTADSENNDTSRPWWQVDLQETKPIAHLHIWFRDDCCQSRNNHLRIVILDRPDFATGVKLWETNTVAWTDAVPRELGFDLTPAVNGRAIYVDHLEEHDRVGDGNFICISELEAFDQIPVTVQNYALIDNGGVATSSSCYVSDCTLYGPNQAIDGNLHGATSITGWPWAYSAPDNTAGVDPLPWWQVDLSSAQTVGSVVIWPRRDRTFARYDDIRLTVANQGGTALYQQQFTIQPVGPKFVVNFVPALTGAKTVKIETTDDTADKFLNLPEVQVFAPLPSAPAITFTTDLQPISLNEGQTATLGPVAVTVDGAIRPEDISYRWFRNGVEIPNMAGSWIKSYTTGRILPSNNGDKYKVQASVSGHGVFSTEVALTVTADTTPPALLYANGDITFKKVRVWFSEPVDPVTAQTVANYQVSGGVTITSATLVAPSGSVGDNQVDLVTSALTPGTAYTVTVSGVKDTSAGANTVAAGSTVQFTAWVLTQGYLTFEHYDNLTGSATNDIDTALADPRVIAGTPTTSALLTTSFNTDNIFTDDTHENYFVRVYGWLTPTETADYDFFLRSDDASELYVSSDESLPDPTRDNPVCFEAGCCNSFYEPGTDDATTMSAIPLQAGHRYGVLALLKEGTGGDYMMVAWRKATETTPAAADLPYLPSQFFSTYVDPNADLVFTSQPTDQLGVLASTGVQIYSQDFNANDGGYTVQNFGQNASNPVPPPGPFLYDSGSGTWYADGAESGCSGPYNSQLSSPAITMPQDGQVRLSFDHRYSFETPLWDCGQVRISVNGGDFTLVPAENFTENGYAEGAIIGNGIALGSRGFNGDSPGHSTGAHITSKAVLGTFKQGDKLVIQFVGAWDDCTTASIPGWEIDSVKLEQLPMKIQNFASGDGGFTAVDSGAPPAGWSGWAYEAADGTWTAKGATVDCGGPFNSKLTSPAYTVPQADEVTLSFTHRYSFEGDYYDGGQVWISVNGGAFTPVSPDNFTANGYAPGNIVGTGIINGQRAFNGDSEGFATGNFITSSVILGNFNANDTIAVQFVGAWDECWAPGQPGWVIKSLELTYGKTAKRSTFAAEASASRQGAPVTPSYQWQRNDGAGWVDIPYATSASYSIYPTAADMAAHFRLVVSVPGKSITSNEVKLVTSVVVETPTLAISTTPTAVTITYTGTLQSATNVTGPYSDVAGATSPYTVPTTAGAMFYRAAN